MNRSCLEKLYFSYIRPLLEYGDIIWDNSTNEIKNDIEAVQHEAARIVTGATKLCGLANLYTELKWESLEQRRKKHKLIQLYKIKHNLTPAYLTELIPADTQFRYNLRNADNIPFIHSNSQLYSNSFLPSAIRAWNTLPETVRHAPTLSIFKSRINLNIRKSSPLFNIGNRREQILHARLRLSCSALNYDLYRKNIVNSPLCTCGAQETVTHFLLHCPLYQQQRNELLTNINIPPLTENLLYGNEHLTFEENKDIFLQLQKFIMSTNRF